DMWYAERTAKQKSPTVAVLCKWYDKGMITLDDMLQRVRNLNYSEVDALRIVESCQMDVKARRQKELHAALDKQAKAAQAAAREDAKLLREARQAARALKLTHTTKHKQQIKRKDGSVTTTITDTIVDTPDVNVSNTSETVVVSGGTA